MLDVFVKFSVCKLVFSFCISTIFNTIFPQRLQKQCNHIFVFQLLPSFLSVTIYYTVRALFPGPHTQLSVACSMVKLTVTTSDGKLVEGLGIYKVNSSVESVIDAHEQNSCNSCMHGLWLQQHSSYAY